MREQEWISVKDRLPAINIGVLVYDSGDVFEAYRDKTTTWKAEIDLIEIVQVTHWMPKPSPPKN